MSDEEQRVRELLAGLDEPRSPTPSFERSLRQKLFGRALLEPTGSGWSETNPERHALDASPSRQDATDFYSAPEVERQSRKHLIVLVAAALLLVVIAVVGLAVRRSDSPNQPLGTVDAPTTLATPSSPDPDAAQAACRRFRTTAFGKFTRGEILGPQPSATLRTPDQVVAAALRVREATLRLQTDLANAGVGSTGIDGQIATAVGLANRSIRFSATIEGTNSLNRIEEVFIDLDRRLTAEKVAGCL